MLLLYFLPGILFVFFLCGVLPNAVGMGIPAVGGILYSMRNEGNLKLSQKLIHTRVYGQMTVVSMVVAMMGFQEIMRRNGGLFVVSEPEDEEEAAEDGDGSAVVPRSP